MGPRWFNSGADGDKRASPISPTTTTSQNIQRLVQHPLDGAQQSCHSSLESPQSLSSSSHRQSRTWKRHSLFARSSPSLDSGSNDVDSTPSPQVRASPESAIPRDPVFKPAEIVSRRSAFFARKEPARVLRTADSVNDSIKTWIRGEDKPVPASGSSPRQEQNGDIEDGRPRDARKSVISGPFDFQHVAHTNRSNVPADFTQRISRSQSWATPTHQPSRRQSHNYGKTSAVHRDAYGTMDNNEEPRERDSGKFLFKRSTTLAGLMSGVKEKPLNNYERFMNESSAAQQQTSMLRSVSTSSFLSDGDASVTEMCSPPLNRLDQFDTESFVGDGAVSTGYGLGLDVVHEERDGHLIGSSLTPSSRKLKRTSLKTPPGQVTPPPPQPVFSSMDLCLGSAESSISRSSAEGRRIADSLPSLWSGDSWEDDVDYIYHMEAESTCDFDWDSRNGSVVSPDLRDDFSTYALPTASPYGGLPHTKLGISPRVSIARHQRRSLIFTDSSRGGLDSFDPFGTDEFDYPRTAQEPPTAPLRQMPSLSTLGRPMSASISSEPSIVDGGNEQRSPIHANDLSQAREDGLAHSGSSALSTRTPSYSVFEGNEPNRRWTLAAPLQKLGQALRNPASVDEITPSLASTSIVDSPLQLPPQTPLPDVPSEASPIRKAPSAVWRRSQSRQDRLLPQVTSRAGQPNPCNTKPAYPSRLWQVQSAGVSPSRLRCERSKSTPNMSIVDRNLPPLPAFLSPQGQGYPAWI